MPGWLWIVLSLDAVNFWSESEFMNYQGYFNPGSARPQNLPLRLVGQVTEPFLCWLSCRASASSHVTLRTAMLLCDSSSFALLPISWQFQRGQSIYTWDFSHCQIQTKIISTWQHKVSYLALHLSPHTIGILASTGLSTGGARLGML